MVFRYANQKYNASLTAGYTVGDPTLSVNTIPSHVPTIVTVARGTSKETRFTVTGTGAGQLTGVARLDGANENISEGASVECMNDDDFTNQLASVVFDQPGLKGLIYAADGGSTDDYEITLPVAPSALSDILGIPILFKANTANTGAATLAVNGLAATPIKKSKDVALETGDIKAGQIVTVVYDGTNFQLQSQAVDSGWNNAGETPTYASASTMNVASGAANKYQPGDPIRFKQGGDWKYGNIKTVADTLLTIFVNTDHVIANAAITDFYYSHDPAPMGFPTWFNCTLSPTGLTSISEGSIYKVEGRSCTVITVISGTSNATSLDITLPAVAAAVGASSINIGGIIIMDNSAWKTVMGILGLAIAGGASATARFGIDASTAAANAYGGFTASGGKAVSCEFTFKF